MKIFPRLVLTILIPALLLSASVGGSANQVTVAAPMPDSIAGDMVGSGAWGDFFSGVACGAGIALAVSGYMSGIAAPAALVLTAGIISQCARAMGM